MRPRLRSKPIIAFSVTPHVSLVYASPPIELRQLAVHTIQMPELSWDVEGSHPYAAYPLRITKNNMHATSDNSHDPHIRLHARGKRYLTSSSHSKSHGQRVIYGARITGDIG